MAGIPNGCVVDALTDLLGDGGFDAEGVIAIIKDNDGDGYPLRRIGELVKFAPVVVHEDGVHYIHGSAGKCYFASASGPHTIGSRDKVIVIADSLAGGSHAVCISADGMQVFHGHISAVIHRRIDC